MKWCHDIERRRVGYPRDWVRKIPTGQGTASALKRLYRGFP